MGCCCSCSRTFRVQSSVSGQDEHAMQVFEELFLTQSDLNLLYNAFCDIDADDSGVIRSDELFAYLCIESTQFNKKLFAFFDDKQTGYLNFLEFVVVIWNFLTFDSNEFGRFAFFLFDDNNTGTLEVSEIETMMETIHHKTLKSSPEVRALVQSLSKSKFKADEFMTWTKNHQSLLAPIIALQYNLRRQIIGEFYWQEIASMRKQRYEFNDDMAVFHKLKNQLETIKRNDQQRRQQQRMDAERLENLDALSKQRGDEGALEKYRKSRLLSWFELKRKDNGNRPAKGFFASFSRLDTDTSAVDDKPLPVAPRQRRSSSIFIPKPVIVRKAKNKKQLEEVKDRVDTKYKYGKITPSGGIKYLQQDEVATAYDKPDKKSSKKAEKEKKSSKKAHKDNKTVSPS